MSNTSPNIVEIAEATLKAANETPELDTGVRAFELLELLTTETKKLLNEGVDMDKWLFTKQELADSLRIKTERDSQRKEINRLIKDLNDKLQYFKPAIQNRLFKANYRQIISVNEIMEGRRKYVYLKANPLEEKEPSSVGQSTPELVHYEPISEKSIYGNDQLELTKKTILVLLSVPSLLLLALFGSIFIDLFIQDIQLTKIAIVALCLPLFPIIASLLKLLQNGLILAPWWLKKPMTLQTTMVTLDHSHSDNSNRLRIVIRSYKANCPICGAYLDIKKGKHHLKGRFVGQCEVTNEHLYTFDHVKERGVPANTPMFLPD